MFISIRLTTNRSNCSQWAVPKSDTCSIFLTLVVKGRSTIIKKGYVTSCLIMRHFYLAPRFPFIPILLSSIYAIE